MEPLIVIAFGIAFAHLWDKIREPHKQKKRDKWAREHPPIIHQQKEPTK